MNYHAFQDSLGDWAHEHSEELKAHDTQYTAPQGRESQGWPIRRCSPEMACWAPEDQSESADMEVVIWLLKGLAVLAAVLFCVWVIAGWPYV